MRVLFDALGSTEYSGGMRLHSTEIIRSWSEEFPDDEIAVISGKWATADLGPYASRIWAWPNESALFRSIGQVFGSAVLARSWRPDAVVSLSPIVTPFARYATRVCFQHDWRHVRRPQEFPIHQKLYRKLWKWSASWADVTACISKKALEETLRVAPKAHVQLVENGRDHARRWGRVKSEKTTPPTIVTFGHHNNKRPDLAIRAFASVREQLPENTTLYVLGARGNWKEELESLASNEGVAAKVKFPGFVEELEYQEIVSSCSCVVLVSTDEGFGLPVAEAEYFGIPAVVANDSGMGDIFSDFAFTSPPNPPDVGNAILNAVTSGNKRGTSKLWRWKDGVHRLRMYLHDELQTTSR